MLVGQGGSGKGTFVRVIAALFGKNNTAHSKLDVFEKNEFEKAKFAGKSLIIFNESKQQTRNAENLKRLTGGDEIEIRRMHEQPTGASFQFRGAVVVTQNDHAPYTDSGLNRRRATIKLHNKPPDGEVWTDEQERARFQPELPGIANWLLALSPTQISLTLRQKPPRISDADSDAITAACSVAEWLSTDSRIVYAPGEHIEIGTADGNVKNQLFAAYRWWFQTSGRSLPVGLNEFKNRMVTACTAKGWAVEAWNVGGSRRSAIRHIKWKD
jgi:putative DNA primase/helicase